MASSVSSERAFSQAGITVSKRRNCLKADIVEAVQFLKCAMPTDLIFREPGPSTFIGDSEADEGKGEGNVSSNEEGWESIVIDTDDDDDDTD